MKPIYINEDNLIEWIGAQLASTDAYVVTGTMSWSLKNSAGAELATGSMTYVAASNGDWQGVIPKTATANLVSNIVYTIEVTLTSGANDGFRRWYTRAAYHGDR